MVVHPPVDLVVRCLRPQPCVDLHRLCDGCVPEDRLGLLRVDVVVDEQLAAAQTLGLSPARLIPPQISARVAPTLIRVQAAKAYTIPLSLEELQHHYEVMAP